MRPTQIVALTVLALTLTACPPKEEQPEDDGAGETTAAPDPSPAKAGTGETGGSGDTASTCEDALATCEAELEACKPE